MTSSEGQRLRDLVASVRVAFQQEYEAAPTHVVAAPGRVNIIGEHTDYNDGFVFPAAIDRHVVMAVSPRADWTVRLHAADLDSSAVFDLQAISRAEGETSWSNYQRGVAWALGESGVALRGMDAVLLSDVPVGAGLSSSAAVEVAAALAFQVVGGFALDGVQRALLCQKAENEFVGMRCGIMDQFIVSLGKRDHALFIDCRSLAYEQAAIPAGCRLVICDTKKQRGLVDSEYNNRRQECERGASALGVSSLRDVTLKRLDSAQGTLDPVTFRRCRHVVSENARVLQAVDTLRGDGDLVRIGELMNASHISLRDDYEVSCPELDAMVEAAWHQEGVLGARMTGAGFGGCTINLVREEVVAEDEGAALLSRILGEYRDATGLEPAGYVCRAEEGVRLLD